MRALPLALALIACTDTPCPAGSTRAADGLCYLAPEGDSGVPDSVDGADSTDGSDGSDGTEEPITWEVLEGACEAPDDLGVPPVTLEGEVDLQRSAFVEIVDLAIDSDRGLAFATGQGGFIVADVSDPENPRYLASDAPFDYFQRFYRVAIGRNDVVYATHRDQGLVAWDTSDPERPRATHDVSLPGLSGMQVWGNWLYVVTHDGELVTFDASRADIPVEVHRTGGLANAWQPLVVGDRIYVADNTDGVVVFDRSDAGAPEHVATVAAAGGVQELAISEDGSTLYAGVGGAGVEIFSLDDPDLPVSIGRLDLHYSVQSVDVSGDTLWAVNQQDVVAIDVAVPREPVVLGTKQTRQWAMHVAAAEGRAWVGDWGWLESFQVDRAATEPDADPSLTSLFLDATGDQIELQVANLGAGALELTGVGVGDDRLTVEVSGTTIAPGEVGHLRVTYAGGGGLDAEICVSTNDPDEPLQTLSVRDGASGERGDWLGSPAQEFELEGLDGERYRLSEQLGHPVVLVYFATW